MQIFVNVYNRLDLLNEQRRLFKKHLDKDIISVGFGDGTVEPDIKLECSNKKLLKWPYAYLMACGEIIKKFRDKDDFLILESDIFPIKEIEIEKWPSTVIRKYHTTFWPSIFFSRKGTKYWSFYKRIGKLTPVKLMNKFVSSFPKDAKFLPFEHTNKIPQDFEIDVKNTKVRSEIIDNSWYHVNAGRTKVVNPLMKKRKDICSECDASPAECYVRSVGGCKKNRILADPLKPCPRNLW